MLACSSWPFEVAAVFWIDAKQGRRWLRHGTGAVLPRAGPAMNGTTGTDPLYRALGNGIYWYEIKS